MFLLFDIFFVLLFLIISDMPLSAETEISIEAVSFLPNKKRAEMSFSERAAVDLLTRIQSPINPKVNLLDMGSGKGEVAKTLSECFPNGTVTGIDLLQDKVEASQQRFPVEHYPNLTFYQGDAECLEIEEKFDLIVSMSLLHLVNNQERVLRELFQALKPGGIMIVQIPEGFAKPLAKAGEDILINRKWKPYFSHFKLEWTWLNLNEYKQILNEIGFKVIRAISFEDNQILSSYQETKLFFENWHPYLMPIPQSMRDSFLEELTSLYFKYQPLNSNGQVPFIVRRIELEVQKLLE